MVQDPTPVSLLERLRLPADVQAWEHFVRLYTPLIHGWLSRQQLQAVDLDDLVQDVLLVVVREIPQFQHDGRPGAFRAWLRQVTVHRLYALWRSRRLLPQGTGDSAFVQTLEQLEDPASPLSRRWEQDHDQYLVGRLLQVIEKDFEPETWQAFRRQAVDGHRASDVARELGLSVNAVLLARSRVLRRLRQEAAGFLD